jgi:hypothetical protein
MTDNPIERKTWMTGEQVREARIRLGELWDKKPEPISNARLARSVRLGGRDPGLNVTNWESGKTAVSGPVSALIELYLRGAKPPDGLPKGGPVRGAEHHWSNENPRNKRGT